MKAQSLGLIEVVGLTNAIEAADAAVKSANVELGGYEVTKGGGLVLVKVMGEVGAVKAAVESAINAVERKNGKVYSHKVIARMGENIDQIVFPKKAEKKPESVATPQAAIAPKEEIEVKNIEEAVEECASCVDLITQAEEAEIKAKKPIKGKK
ncbi:hypothetical protein A1D22_04350 [Pasteurellaceae bacterium LFhippo2]|nr:hypothetical protein [Pasteurellaceae bacterium LFhippo2]